MASTEHLAKALGGRQPLVPADLSLKKIKDQIPAHYFQQNHWKSGYYVCRDLAQTAVAAAAMYYGLMPLVDSLCGAEPSWARSGAMFVAWNLYAFFQGVNWTGLWVLAHECGHQSFSPYRSVNDGVGMVLHSALLVPYHSWRITHGNHHKHTNHLEQDTVFLPPEIKKSEADRITKETAAKVGSKEPSVLQTALEESPLASLGWVIIMLTIGWPGYLLWNAAGGKYKVRTNHFEPSSPLFKPFQRSDIIASDLGLLVVFGLLGIAANTFGLANVALWYGAPYLWVNAWLVYITYLQHTDVRLPHYRADEWTFVAGALAAVDRNYGAYFNWALHHINDSHVMHHLFSTMPFYNAIQVTRKHNAKIFGDLWIRDARPLHTMLWESWRACRVVVPEEGVTFFRTA